MIRFVDFPLLSSVTVCVLMFAFRYGRSSDRPNVQFNHTTNKAIDRGHLPYFFCCDFIDFLKTRKFLSAACCETSPLRSRKVASVEQVGERFLARWRIEHVLFLDAPKARRGARRPIAPAAAWTPSPSYVTPCGPQSLRARDTPPKRHSPGRVPSKAWHRPVSRDAELGPARWLRHDARHLL